MCYVFVSQSYLTFCDLMDCSRLLHPWDSPGKNTGVGCHFIPQEIFSIQGSNPGLPHCRQTLYHLSYQGSLMMMPQEDQKGKVHELEIQMYRGLHDGLMGLGA